MGTAAIIQVEAIPATPNYAEDVPREHMVLLKAKGKGIIGVIEMLATGQLRIVDERNRIWILDTHKIWEELSSVKEQL